jgi:hypothetical protein
MTLYAVRAGEQTDVLLTQPTWAIRRLGALGQIEPPASAAERDHLADRDMDGVPDANDPRCRVSSCICFSMPQRCSFVVPPGRASQTESRASINSATCSPAAICWGWMSLAAGRPPDTDGTGTPNDT